MRNKKALRTVVCLLMLVLLSACGNASETPAESPAPAAEQQALPEDDRVTVASPETAAPEQGVTLNGETFSADAEALAPTVPVSDLAALGDVLTACTACRSVTLSRNFDPSQCAGGLSAFEERWSDLLREFPDVSFSDELLIGGVPAETLETYAVPADADPEREIRTIVSCCPALSEIDLTAVFATAGTVAAAVKETPGVRFLWNDETYGASASDAAALAFSGAQDPDTLKEYLACFPSLSEIDLSEASLSEEQINGISDRFPGAAVRRTVLLNGVPTDSFSEELDLSGAQIDAYEAFSDAVGRFPKLRELKLHDCSLSNEQLAALRDRYPQVKVVWTVKFGRWTVATDAVAFSTLQPGDSTYRMHTEDVQVLRYCRDLIVLDLGHNDITDLKWITELKNLQVLILAENRRLKDITPLGTLSKLKYLELFLTGVEDISPLANLSGLLDVNLCYAHISDITPLLSCKKLERIWLGEKVAERIGKEGVQTLETAFPNAEFDFVSAGSTKRGWREHPRFLAFRQMIEENVAVEPFLP